MTPMATLCRGRKKQAHFAQASAFLPARLETMPNLDKQNASSASADDKSTRWRKSVEAEVGAGDRR